MTISEQLHFSILSAPIAASDRRVLSQAWYSALYRANSKAPAAPRSPQLRVSNIRAPQNERPKPSAAARRLSPPVRMVASTATMRPAMACERRSPRLQLARKMERLVRHPQTKRAAATFVLDGARARVRVLVSVEGGRMRLIAICSKRVEKIVAAALAQARYAAASRGSALEAGTLGEVQC